MGLVTHHSSLSIEERRLSLTMKTLFVNPPNDNPMTDLKAIEPPIWCAILAGLQRELETDVSIWDVEVDSVLPTIDYDRVFMVVMGSNPSVSSTPKMPIALKLGDYFKGKGASVLFTGLHIPIPGAFLPFTRDLVKIAPAWDLID